jgi:hypothetical protein
MEGTVAWWSLIANVPWKEVIRHAPGVIDRTEALLGLIRASRARPVDPEVADADEALRSLVQRLDALEQGAVSQAELLAQAASHQERLARAVQVLATRLTIALCLSAAALVAALAAILLLLRG